MTVQFWLLVCFFLWTALLQNKAFGKNTNAPKYGIQKFWQNFGKNLDTWFLAK